MTICSFVGDEDLKNIFHLSAEEAVKHPDYNKYIRGIIKSNQGRRNFFIDSRISPDRYSNDINPKKKNYTGLKGGILMKIRDIKKARLEHRSVYCIDKDTSDVLRCSVGLWYKQ